MSAVPAVSTSIAASASDQLDVPKVDVPKAKEIAAIFGNKEKLSLEEVDCLLLEKISDIAQKRFAANMPCYFFALVEEPSDVGYRIFDGSNFANAYFKHDMKRNPMNRKPLIPKNVHFYFINPSKTADKTAIYTAHYFCSLRDMLNKTDQDPDGDEYWKASVFANDETLKMHSYAGYTQMLAYIKFAQLAKQAKDAEAVSKNTEAASKNAEAGIMFNTLASSWLKLSAGLGYARANFILSREKNVSVEDRIRLLEEALRINHQEVLALKKKLVELLVDSELKVSSKEKNVGVHDKKTPIKEAIKEKLNKRKLDRAIFTTYLAEAYILQAEKLRADKLFAEIPQDIVKCMPPEEQDVYNKVADDLMKLIEKKQSGCAGQIAAA